MRQQAQLAQGRNLYRQLQHATEHDPDRQTVNRLNAATGQPRRAQPSAGNHADIEHHRRGRRHGKAPPSVEHTCRQSHHRHEGNIGKHDPRQIDRGLQTLRGLAQAAGHQPDQTGCCQNAQYAGQQYRPSQQGSHLVYQQAGGVIALFGPGGRQHRHECLTERPFREQAAK